MGIDWKKRYYELKKKYDALVKWNRFLSKQNVSYRTKLREKQGLT